ncbi:hypothetical protein ACFX1T_028442 [Malus domestica]
MVVRSLIKILLVYGKGRRQEREQEEQEWQEEASTSQHGNREESCSEELDRAIQMAECIYDLDGLDDLPESPELVEFYVQNLINHHPKFRILWKLLI